MDLIDHTIAWCRGEIFEGRIYALFGLAVTVISLLYWRAGTTPAARAMFVPLLIVGLLTGLTGLSLDVKNRARIPEYQRLAAADEEAFGRHELARTAAFIRWYPLTRWSVSGLIVAGLLAFLLVPSPRGRAIGLALVLFGLSVLFLDHFSEERARTYQARILERLGS